MRVSSVLDRVWVRALVAPIVYVAFCRLLFVTATRTADRGDPGFGTPLFFIMAMSVFLALIIGPAWVLQPRMNPEGDGPPRGGIIPLPLRTPDQPTDAGEEPYAAA